MPLVLETGAGVQDANAYVTAAFVDSYLSDRNRSTENSWDTLTTAVKEAYIIAATQYIDTRWGARFRGVRAVFFDGQVAGAQLTFSGNPSASDTVTIGNYTYTFVASLTVTNNFEVLIGASQADTMTNLVNAINEGDNNETYSETLITNQHAEAKINDDDANIIDLSALQEGEAGNDITLSESSTVIAAVGFTLGRDAGSQPLEFPRSSLYDPEGVLVQGVPRRLKEATSEYAVRQASTALYQDPVIDASGRAITKEKIGPIETEYTDGGSLDLLIRPYPGADRLLANYVVPSGRVMR